MLTKFGLDRSHNYRANHRYALHVVAESLGMTVGELKARMTLDEFYDWLAFYRVRHAKAGGK